jgi:hypothetical protein
MPDKINSIEYFVPQRTNIMKLFMVSYQKEQILDRTNTVIPSLKAPLYNKSLSIKCCLIFLINE